MRSQSSVEFLVLASILFLFFVGLVAVVGIKMIDYQDALDSGQIQDIMDVVKTEIQLASTSMDGYQRAFFLPESINGKPYEMTILKDNTFLLLFEGKRYEYPVSQDLKEGTTVYKGKNIISKFAGNVYVDSSDPCKNLTEGDNSYCIGGGCYCFGGYYDPNCLTEDDVNLDFCANASSDNPLMQTPISCTAIDHCNIPPIFLYDTPNVAKNISGDEITGEESVTINVAANERFIAILNYAVLGDRSDNEGDNIVIREECNELTTLDAVSASYGPFDPNNINSINFTGLLPDKVYCFNVLIKDMKGSSNSSIASPSSTFITKQDRTPPLLKSMIIDPPNTLYLGSSLRITADIYEPSGINLDDSRIIINSTRLGSNIGEVEEYPLIYGNDAYSADFVIEDNFTDPNASFDYEEGATLFYNTFDYPGFYADHAEGSPVPYTGFTSYGPPSIEKARFSNGALFDTDDDQKDMLRFDGLSNIHKEKGTIEFWVNSSWAGASTGEYVMFDAADPPNPFNRMLIGKNGEMLYFIINVRRVDTGSSFFYYKRMDLSTWQPDKWHFIAATWDLTPVNEADRSFELYIDGSNEGSEDGGTLQSFDAPGFPVFFFIGSDYDGDNQSEAVIDQFAISNYPKTDEQILNDMQTSRTYSIDLYLKDTKGIDAYYSNAKTFSVLYTDMPEQQSP